MKKKDENKEEKKWRESECIGGERRWEGWMRRTKCYGEERRGKEKGMQVEGRGGKWRESGGKWMGV